MIEAVTWETAHLYGDALASQHRLRYRLFIERHAWDIPSYHGMEYDQYDTPAATYLIYRDRQGEARGVTRLIPTTRPYMIQELWPDMVQDGPLPVSERIWEGSRFGIDNDLPTAERALVGGALVAACLEHGLAHGLDSYYVLMPSAIIRRVIGGVGCPFEWTGPAQRMGKYKVAVARVPVTRAALAAVRDAVGITRPVLVDDQPLRVAA
ncbi:MAG: hypothetical protein KDE22_14245 [Rhodobacterales bacterium]|nr:hypothetical protein [Rhodobacterales bacterium]